jgi:DNA-binding NarL/FixJ family response regulator
VDVLLIDDHVMFRQGLRLLLGDLEKNLTFSEAGSCNEALQLIADNSFNLILLDLHMPGTKGFGALNAITAAVPSVPVAVLSGEENPTVIRDAIEAGASGYVPKSLSSEILIPALKLILAGGIYLPKNAIHVTESIADGFGKPTPVAGNHAKLLSGRQTEVLLRAIKGQANKVIALDLGIAEGTVKTHLSAAFKVLGVHNRTEAVYAAAKLGIKPAPVISDAMG